MDLVTKFIKRYRKEYDFYENLCHKVALVLDTNLQSGGIRAIVTSRAKNPTRLEEKVRQRAIKIKYKSVEDIYDDIVDLAGVRVALYFPGEREEVDKIIQGLFCLVVAKNFPTSVPPTYKKRFSGYWATHYRIQIPDGSLNESEKKYGEAKVEIQVASVLMHAWSEVEHDLVYKPQQGILSEEEYAILDELNGLVLSGEIALERLQRSGELRASRGREYTNHYDLAASILEMSRINLGDVNRNETAIGKVDDLYHLLKATNLNTPDQLARFVKILHSDFEKRPLSEQIIDQLLFEDSSRYEIYKRILLAKLLSPAGDASRTSQNQAIGAFMTLWIEYEKRLRSLASSAGKDVNLTSPIRLITHIKNLPSEVLDSAKKITSFRNLLVHGIEVPSAETINDASTKLRSLLDKLLSIPSRKPRKP